jgi:hypothetical protein
MDEAKLMNCENSPVSSLKFIKKRDNMRELTQNEMNALKKCNADIKGVICFLEDNNVEISKFSIWTVLSRKAKEEVLELHNLKKAYDDLKTFKTRGIVLREWEECGGLIRDQRMS